MKNAKKNSTDAISKCGITSQSPRPHLQIAYYVETPQIFTLQSYKIEKSKGFSHLRSREQQMFGIFAYWITKILIWYQISLKVFCKSRWVLSHTIWTSFTLIIKPRVVQKRVWMNHPYDIINSSERDHPSPWGIAARRHISYRGDISLWYNNVESLAVSTAWNDKIKLLNFSNSVWWVMDPSSSRALSSFTTDMLIVFRWFCVWHTDW